MQLQNKTAVRAVLVALAMVFSFIESQIPYPIPGAKLGLSNLIVLVALYRLSVKDAVGINLIRIVLVGFTFGNMFSLVYSLAGGILSTAIMILMKKTDKFKIVSVSIAGGITHNIGQILVAMYVLKTTAILSYLPILWMTGLIAGIVIGILGNIILERLPHNLSKI